MTGLSTEETSETTVHNLASHCSYIYIPITVLLILNNLTYRVTLKDETSETTLIKFLQFFLLNLWHVNWFLSLYNHLVYFLKTSFMAKSQV